MLLPKDIYVEIAEREKIDESIKVEGSELSEEVITTSIKEDVVLNGQSMTEVAFSNYSVLKG